MPLSVMWREVTKIALGRSRLPPAVMSRQGHALTDKNPRSMEALNSNSREVLGLYRKRPLRGIMNHIGVGGRFRYSDLKEAAGYGI